MTIDSKLTDEALLRVLGERVAADLTQGQLAEQAAIDEARSRRHEP